MNIYFYPHGKSSNKYVQNLLNSLEKEGINIVNRGRDNTSLTQFKYSLSKQVDAVHFNWILRKASGDDFKNYFKTYKTMGWVKLLKSLGKKIIWTMHNKVPHRTANLSLVLKLRKFIIKNSDMIIIHCKESKNILKKYLSDHEMNNKVIYVPHGHYIDNYQDECEDLRKNYNIEQDDFVYAFLGHVQPYKNIELIIKAFQELNLPNSKLLIGGKPANDTFKEEINNIIDSKDVIFIPEFIPEDMIVKFFNTVNVMVLPFNKKSVLNSGSLFLSLSLKTPVIIPEIGSVQDIGKSKDFIFSYDYTSPNKHIKNLKEKMLFSYNLFKENQAKFSLLGKQACKYVENQNNWDEIAVKLRNEYYRMIK